MDENNQQKQDPISISNQPATPPLMPPVSAMPNMNQLPVTELPQVPPVSFPPIQASPVQLPPVPQPIAPTPVSPINININNEPASSAVPTATFTSLETPTPEVQTTASEVPVSPKKKNKILPLILGVLAVLLIGGIAGASYFVSSRLSQQTAVAPNAPESKPMAGDCSSFGTIATCQSVSGLCSWIVCNGVGEVPGNTGCYTPGTSNESACHNGCPSGQIFCGGCISGCKPDNLTCNEHIANECSGDTSTGGDCFANGCNDGKCCLCRDGRDPATGNCRNGGSTNSYCGSCSDPGADVIQCGTQTCDQNSQKCCPNGCKGKDESCDGTTTTTNNEACYYDTRGDINGKTVVAGQGIHIAGWGGICRDGKLLTNRVDAHLCDLDMTNCVSLKSTLKTISRSESDSQKNFCATGVPGATNTIGFDDNVTIPNTITPGQKRVKVVYVVPKEVAESGGVQLSKWCEDALVTVTTPTCTPNGTITCTPDCPTACGTAASTITTCTNSCGAAVTKTCAATVACTAAPACVAVSVGYNLNGTWNLITKDYTGSIADIIKIGNTIRLYADVNASTTKVRFKATRDGVQVFTPEWKDGIIVGTQAYVEFTINNAGAYTFVAEVQ